MNVQQYLDDKKVSYDVIPHRDTYTAQRLAETLHTPGGQIAKTVLLKADRGYTYLVAVVPASRDVDLHAVSAALGGSLLEVASEADVQQHCGDCELGVLPPFGTQYGMQTLVDESLLLNEEIVFEGNTHHEAIRMRFDDYRRLEEPLVGKFAT